MAQRALEGAARLSDGRGWPPTAPEMLHQAGLRAPGTPGAGNEAGRRPLLPWASVSPSIPWSGDFESVVEVEPHGISDQGVEGAEGAGCPPALLGSSRVGQLIPPPQRREGVCRLNVSGSETQGAGVRPGQGRAGTGSGRDRVSLGPRPSLGLPPGRGGTGVSLTGRVLQPLGLDRCRSRSRLFEKSFSVLPGPTESPIDQPTNDGYGWVAVQGPACTQASPVGETVMGELCA